MIGLTNFAQCLQTRLRQQFPGWSPAGLKSRVQKSRQLDCRRLGEMYLHSTRPYTGHTRSFIDKMPLNFLYIGLIRCALPGARIIHIKRDPMDHCYSIYKHLFNQAYPFSYRLDELAQYYLAYQRVMQHWLEQLPEIIHVVQYEELIADPGTTARALYDFCGIDWQSHCIDFHLHNSQPSGTGSASQIRSPLHDSSVGRWRHYEKQLAPLQRWLDVPQSARRSAD